MFKTKRKLLNQIAKLKIDVATLIEFNTRTFKLLQERDVMYQQLFEKYFKLKEKLNEVYGQVHEKQDKE